MKCKYCGKEFKNEKGLKLHLNRYCKEYKEVEVKEDNETILDIVETENVENDVIKDLISFFDGIDIDNISLNKEGLNKLRELHLAYFGRAMLENCHQAIIGKYRQMYYIAEKHKKELGYE